MHVNLLWPIFYIIAVHVRSIVVYSVKINDIATGQYGAIKQIVIPVFLLTGIVLREYLPNIVSYHNYLHVINQHYILIDCYQIVKASLKYIITHCFISTR